MSPLTFNREYTSRKELGMTVAIFGYTMKPSTLREVSHIIEFMHQHNVQIILSQELRQELKLREYPEYNESLLEQVSHIDFAISVGGDGTFLTTASHIGSNNIPIIGINCGHLGFLADVQTQEVDLILNQLLQGDYLIDERNLLSVTTSGDRRIVSPYALNEIAVMKQGLSSMISIDTYVNGEHLNTYEADGLIVATPTGSTAYNLSVGGPLMMPQTKGILLSPIATHSLYVRPLVIPDNWKIDLSIKSRNSNYLISVDGRSQVMADSNTLHIEKSTFTIKLIQIGNRSFLQSLKNKLNWGK